VFVEGEQYINRQQNCVGLFSHGSNLDPFIVASGPLAFKWVGKQSLFNIPIFGWALSCYGHIAIERGDRQKAISSLEEAAKRIHLWGRSIALSPEGTRSTTGRLLEFKKGPFHLAETVRLPLVPMIILGAYDLWPPGQAFVESGDVTIRFLPPIKIRPSDDHNTLLSRSRRVFLQGTMAPRDRPAQDAMVPTAIQPRVRVPYCSEQELHRGKWFPWAFCAVLFAFSVVLYFLYRRR